MTDNKNTSMRIQSDPRFVVMSSYWDQHPGRVCVFKKMHEDSQIPAYQTEGAACCDVHAYVKSPIASTLSIPPGGRALVSTGLLIRVRDGYECQVRSRSGLPLKKGLIIGNSPGTIDPDYNLGELGVILINTSSHEVVTVEHGERIAQLAFAPIVRGTFGVIEAHEYVDPDVMFGRSTRGQGGFGSTGA